MPQCWRKDAQEMKNILLTFILFSFFNITYAQTSEGYISIRGSGNFKCGEYVSWVETQNQMQLNLVNQWVWGFIAAYQFRGNFGNKINTPKQGNIVTPEATTAQLFLKKYCNDNPLSDVTNGTIRMIKELGGIIYGPK
jgi:hypothetical protein